MGITTKTIDGVEYVTKSQFDSTVQGMNDRISKLSTQKNEAETNASALQSQIDGMQGKLGLIDTLQQQNQELQGKLDQSNTRYERHSTLSSIGVNDDSVRAAFEMMYNQQGDDKPAFGDWVNNLKAKPEEAPLLLRNYLGQNNTNQQQQNNQNHNGQDQQPNKNPPNTQPKHQAPDANYGVVGSQVQMSKQQILDRASTDGQFMKANLPLVKHLHNPNRYPKPEQA